MRKLFSALLLSLTFVSQIHADELGGHYVTAHVLNERASPVDGEVVNKLYIGQKVIVYEVRNGWALVTEPGYESRWVSMKYLSREKPEMPKAAAIPSDLKDPRIDASGMPKAGEYNLTKKDVENLWRGANLMLKNGRCSAIHYADKSTSKANTYYVNCGSRNVFFTEADLYD